MRNIEHTPIQKEIIAVLESRPELLQAYVDEALEDYFFARMIEEGKTGIEVSEEEVMKTLKE